MTTTVRLYCGRPGHFIAACPARLMLPRTLLWSHDTISFSFLVDSGADDSFNVQDLVTQASLPTEVLSEPKTVLGLILAKITSTHTLNPPPQGRDSAFSYSCVLPRWRPWCALVSPP